MNNDTLLSRRRFFAHMLTGFVVAGATGELIARVVPKISEGSNENEILAEYSIDLNDAKYVKLATPFQMLKVTGTGITSGSIIVMRKDADSFVVYKDQCTHEGSGMSTFNNNVKSFICSNHGARFDIDGICTLGPAAIGSKLTSYPYEYDKANNKLYLNRIVSVNDVQNDTYMVRNFPNPADEETIFQFALDKPGVTSLEIFDQNGRKVATVFNGMRDAGQQQVVFNLRGLATGSYVYQLRTADGFVTNRTLTILR